MLVTRISLFFISQKNEWRKLFPHNSIPLGVRVTLPPDKMMMASASLDALSMKKN